jgi:o-succinylbenzoate synthase
MNASHQKYILQFKRPGGTSRGVLHTKVTHILRVQSHDRVGFGECGVFRGLSIDDRPDYVEKLHWLCRNINNDLEELWEQLKEFPSIQFGLEQALMSVKSQYQFDLFPSKFTDGVDGIPINGLIWMGEASFMKSQIQNKLKSGFTTIKMKIGAIDFKTELSLLKEIRKEYSASEITLRVDANGAFKIGNALEKLKRLSELQIHSIEQPIKKGRLQEMASLCEQSPLPIALDEELIGIFDVTTKKKLLQIVQPDYIILKPSLVGGFRGSEEWIKIAEQENIKWWITSALESNIGLNAIAQWTYTLDNKLPQGLGTGALFTNNFECPLTVSQGSLVYNKNENWNLNLLE